MRTAYRTPALIAASSALALAAFAPALAQDPAAPAQPAAPSTEAPAAPAPAAPAEAASPAAEAPAEPAAPPPTLPTSGDGAVITNLLSKACQPLVNGAKYDDVAKSMGMKKDRKTQKYVLPLAAKTPYQIVLDNPGVNKNVCTLRVQYAPGGDAAIVDGLNVWRFLHQPQLFLHRNEQGASITGAQAVTISWDNRANLENDGAMYGLVFRQEKKADGTAINKNFDQAIVQYTIRKGV